MEDSQIMDMLYINNTNGYVICFDFTLILICNDRCLAKSTSLKYYNCSVYYLFMDLKILKQLCNDHSPVYSDGLHHS